MLAVLEGKMSAPAACRAAKAGELAGLEPFEMPASSAYGYVSQERRRRAGHGAQNPNASPLERTDRVLNRALNVLEYDMGKMESRAKPGARALTAPEVEKIRKVVATMREVKALALASPPQAGGGQQARNATKKAQEAERAARSPEPEGSDLARSMIRDMRAQQKGSSGPAPNGQPIERSQEVTTTVAPTPANANAQSDRETEGKGGGVFPPGGVTRPEP